MLRYQISPKESFVICIRHLLPLKKDDVIDELHEGYTILLKANFSNEAVPWSPFSRLWGVITKKLNNNIYI